VSDGHHEHAVGDSWHAGDGDHAVGAKRDGYAGTDERYEHTARDCSLDARVDVAGAVGGTPAAGAVGQPVSDGC